MLQLFSFLSLSISFLSIKSNDFKLKIIESLLCETFHEVFVWYFNFTFFVFFLTVFYTSNSGTNDHRKTSCWYSYKLRLIQEWFKATCEIKCSPEQGIQFRHTRSPKKWNACPSKMLLRLLSRMHSHLLSTWRQLLYLVWIIVCNLKQSKNQF